jgi:hypothetical protein
VNANGVAAGAIIQFHPYISVTRDPSTGLERREHIEPNMRVFAWSDGHALGACDAHPSIDLNTVRGRRILTTDGQGGATLWRPKSQ